MWWLLEKPVNEEFVRLGRVGKDPKEMMMMLVVKYNVNLILLFVFDLWFQAE